VSTSSDRPPDRPIDRPIVAEPVRHGGLLDSELAALGLQPAQILDLSVNVNPYGPSPAVATAVRTAALARYPDPTGRAAREALAARLGCAPEAIALGNGAAELLWTLARILVPAGASAVAVEPTFSELAAAVVAGGGRLLPWRAAEATGFAVDLAAVGALLRSSGSRTLYLCNPGNPTGVALAAAEVAAFASAHPDVTILLDQAFLSLSERAAELSAQLPDNVVAIRSLTKDHALPGVRIGYAVAAPALIARLEAARPPWTTSAAAQAAAAAAAGPEAVAHVEACRRRLLADRDLLAAALRRVGLAPLPSATLFLLVRIPDAAALRRRLLERHRILVRDCASFGLPDHVRICARPAPDIERLVAALAAELPGTRAEAAR
jgi:histidinol-phosphate/aromatic aminotransferase/cobyric acid decarboxylase-like protein